MVKFTGININEKPFVLKFDDNWLKQDYILEAPDGVRARVLSKPKRKWYKILLQVITLGFYKAPWEYLLGIDDSNWKYNPTRHILK